MGLLATATKHLLIRRLPALLHSLDHPAASQQATLLRLIQAAKGTSLGQQHRFDRIRDISSFQQSLPVVTYEQVESSVHSLCLGADNSLWPGKVHWFAKSSGTTQRSKLIPITKASLKWNHFAVGRDMGALYFRQRPDSLLFEGKALTVGGSHGPNPPPLEGQSGDLSAVLIKHLPQWYGRWRTPRSEVALEPNWDKKLEQMARLLPQENVTNLHGVPSWTLVMLQRLMASKGVDHLGSIWPQLEVFFHGGISFQPYRSAFHRITEGMNIRFIETYNASEGFFAVQDDVLRDDLALMVNHGIFFEFVPLDELGRDVPRALTVERVETGKTYALVITTCGGLWRYLLGDTVTITTLRPFRVKVAGRIQQFLNTFGEEVMVAHTEAAMAAACSAHRCEVSNYTVRPTMDPDGSGGWHEWIAEFALAPQDIAAFAVTLDAALCHNNSDYEAKRAGSWVMRPAVVKTVRRGTFEEWMRRRGQLGGQHKVPRLSSQSEIAEEILEISGRE